MCGDPLPSPRMELEEQAEDLQRMCEQRLQLLHRSVKRQQTRKRRRVEEEEEGEGEGEEEEEEEEEEEGKAKRRWAVLEADLREEVHELELERNRCEL